MCKVEIQETQNESAKSIEELEAINKQYRNKFEDIVGELEEVSLPRISGINLAAVEMDEELAAMLRGIDDGTLNSIELVGKFLPQLRGRLIVILDAMCEMRKSTERLRDEVKEHLEG